MLKEKALYFPRADRLGDRFEGAKGIASNRTVWDDHYIRFFREAISNPPPGNECNLSAAEVQREAERLLHELAVAGEKQLRTTYVSCWHENAVESEALWRLYCPPPSAGVAVRTTLADLRDALGDEPDIAIGRVEYIDFSKNFADINDAIFRKRQSLSHEREVRAVIRRDEGSHDIGVFHAVDLRMLLRSVVVSPFSPSWFDAVLKETMTRFDVSVDPTASELSQEPFF